ncbi:hypothetical protein JOL62DRAFT_567578, partial [Phyllosticta paracitricarpa]
MAFLQCALFFFFFFFQCHSSRSINFCRWLKRVISLKKISGPGTKKQQESPFSSTTLICTRQKAGTRSLSLICRPPAHPSRRAWLPRCGYRYRYRCRRTPTTKTPIIPTASRPLKSGT